MYPGWMTLAESVDCYHQSSKEKDQRQYPKRADPKGYCEKEYSCDSRKDNFYRKERFMQHLVGMMICRNVAGRFPRSHYYRISEVYRIRAKHLENQCSILNQGGSQFSRQSKLRLYIRRHRFSEQPVVYAKQFVIPPRLGRDPANEDDNQNCAENVHIGTIRQGA
jgi:hypothetical protein